MAKALLPDLQRACNPVEKAGQLLVRFLIITAVGVVSLAGQRNALPRRHLDGCQIAAKMVHEFGECAIGVCGVTDARQSG
jgi:hypothetical protein